jgi:hypothetical protein
LLKNISLLKVNLTTLQYVLVSCLLPSHIITKYKQYRIEYINQTVLWNCIILSYLFCKVIYTQTVVLILSPSCRTVKSHNHKPVKKEETLTLLRTLGSTHQQPCESLSWSSTDAL